MKTIDEYTAQELAVMTNEELDRLVDIEVMKSGIVLPDVPQKPERFKLEKIFPVWDICNGSDVICSFPSEEIAQAVLAASKCYFLKESYIYEVGYQYKYMDICERCDIVKRSAYREEDLRANAKKLKVSSADQDTYEDKKRAYDDTFGKISKLRDHVMSAYWDAVGKKSDAEKIYQTFQKYINLSNGDKEVAMSFLKNAFTAGQIESANSFLPEGKKIE